MTPAPTHRRRPRPLSTAIGLAAGALALLAPVQAGGAQPGQPPQTPAAATPTSIALAEEPLRLPSAGLTMLTPAGSVASTTRIGEAATVRIVPDAAGPDDPRWLINLQTIRPPDDGHTPRSILEAILEAKAESVGTLDTSGSIRSSRAGLIAHDFNLTINDTPAARAYLAVPEVDGSTMAHGYTVFQNGAQRFLVLELITPVDDLPRTRPIYETSVATVRLEDPTALATRRAAAIASGVALMQRLAEADLRAVMLTSEGEQRERWERLYAPAATGSDSDATEAGYRRIRTWIGARGEIDPSRDPQSFRGTDLQQGYLLRMDTRLLQGDPARPTIVDSSAVFFMSMDRNDEAWVIDMGVREPDGQRATWNETGGRDGRSMTIAVSQSGAAPQAVKPLIEGEGYVSRLEAYLLPELLVRHAIPGEFGFYAYQPALQTITFRSDTLTQRNEALWQLDTKLSEDADPQVALYRAGGEHVQTILPDGRVWAPITLQRLAQLWRDKNLPMD